MARESADFDDSTFAGMVGSLKGCGARGGLRESFSEIPVALVFEVDLDVEEDAIEEAAFEAVLETDVLYDVELDDLLVLADVLLVDATVRSMLIAQSSSSSSISKSVRMRCSAKSDSNRLNKLLTISRS
jgi:hypothetical protein